MEDGYITSTNEDGTEVSRKEMNGDPKKNYKMHHKARNFIMNAIIFKKFDKCTNKKIINSIYDALVLTYEGCKQIQEAKANLLVRKYELFYMEEDEDIETMFSRFHTLVSWLKVLQKSYTTVDHVKKILRSLSSKWRPNITTIQKAKDLNSLFLEELINSLRSHKIELAEDDP
ncbi:uncharacterized protein [Cicer arietinum]|uniref:uncharacterized protein n=1 Tax=Cicer arietinum TaxID=3827 RepID=UPI003CC5DBA9